MNFSEGSEVFKNANSPFTELFSLLKRYEVNVSGVPILVYNYKEMEIICQHAENATNILLQGLQEIGCLLGEVDKDNILRLSNIGWLISILSNAIEALNILRSDADFMLAQAKKLTYKN